MTNIAGNKGEITQEERTAADADTHPPQSPPSSQDSRIGSASAYLLALARPAEQHQRLEGSSTSPAIVSEDDSDQEHQEQESKNKTSISSERKSYYVFKPRVYSSQSARKMFKNSATMMVGRPLAMPPRLPRIGAGEVIGLVPKNPKSGGRPVLIL